MPTYRVKQRRVAISRGYDVENEAGERVLRIVGKLGFARTFTVESAAAEPPLSVRETLLAVDPTYAISQDGALRATVRRDTTGGAKTDRFSIDLPAGLPMEASGKLFTDGGVTVSRGGSILARVRRGIGPVTREEFTLETFDAQGEPLLVAIAMAIVESDPARGAT